MIEVRVRYPTKAVRGLSYSTGLPPPQGMYHPQYEKDACGIGFIAQIKGVRSHDLIAKGLQALENLSHRGAVGCDPCTGDGAGLLIQVPHALFEQVCPFDLPAMGAYGVGMLFLPQRAAERTLCEQYVEKIVAEEGARALGWRDVPVSSEKIGAVARATQPVIRQVFVARDTHGDSDFERKLYIIRKRVEHALRAVLPEPQAFYICSFSSRTIVYKGLLLPSQMAGFYDDLANPYTHSAIAMIHSRFSTNTFPTWPRAHPYRYLCHNGEINTLRGNLNWMRAREGRLDSPLFGEKIKSLFPIIDAEQSDSACLDNALEFLLMGGREVAHAMMMLIPEAWQGNPYMDLDRRGFYEYHAAIMEPWDGPAAVAFTDGIRVGATLDRNGLRPARIAITTDDLAILTSEAGASLSPPESILTCKRLQPGKMFLVDTSEGRIIDDEEIKGKICHAKPYRQWVSSHRVSLDELPEPLNIPQPDHVTLRQRQQVFGYTLEDLKMLMTPMAVSGEEAIGSMGTDTPLAVLSDRPQVLFKYFKQLFAQVTNPPIDPIREQIVMSLATYIGPKANLLGETPEQVRRIKINQPILTNANLEKIRSMTDRGFRSQTIPILFPVAEGVTGLARALQKICEQAVGIIRDGCHFIILSDRGINPEQVPIPSLLAVSAVHQHLIHTALRGQVGLTLETGEAREVSHFALLIGYGAASINPYLAFETLVDMVREGYLPESIDEATAEMKYLKAINKGLLKIASKMGISTIQSYCGAQIFEAIGLHHEVVDRYFTGTASRIGGIGLEQIAEESLLRHDLAYRGGEDPVRRLDAGGEYHYRVQGEYHHWNPETIYTLQHAIRENRYETFKTFSRLCEDETARRTTLRGLLNFREASPVPLEEVEPASEIVKRFATGAMSFGSISKEAHETLAIAMNRIGGRSNTGEGGEDPERFYDARNSAIKQVASARFGVTTEYLVSAKELQIKIAQGAKPGEGGQLPGHKVDEVIARTRHAIPGVTLISPPPHHDIYSIEDLAQLIFDLKNVNPAARITVKLVAEVGVGTIAAGVAKARADMILISGDSGGTGASPLSSIKHAGIPWEMGLSETQQTLVLNNLRGRVRLQVDGQLKTGRDVVVAALLGAEEFGFSTAPLIAEGCIMMRKCHLNTCPVGIATQDPLLRKKFEGQPEHVVRYFFFVAEEVREWMSKLGLRTFDDMVGRVDLLSVCDLSDHWKARHLDLSALLYAPVDAASPRRCVEVQDHGLADVLDHELIRLSAPALLRREPVSAALSIRNVHRTVGGMLSGEITRRFGPAGLPAHTIQFQFRGSAGQSFGAFCVKGLSLTLEGEANDYMGKSMSGGQIVISPDRNALFVPEETILIGNTALYGATGGEVYIRGQAGERFAVRNSGASAVVEGVGDHGCEYMTGGTVVVLGAVGRNFAAGMSGGVAYVLNRDHLFERHCNLELVTLAPLSDETDCLQLQGMIERHASTTHSTVADRILERWDEHIDLFVKVIPVEYHKILAQKQLKMTETALA